MKRNRHEAVATALVAAILIPYAGYSFDGRMPLIEDARGMGASGLILGLGAWLALGSDAFGPRWVGIGGAIATMVLGTTAAVLESGTASTMFLGAFVAAIVAMWLVAMVRRLSTTGGVVGRR